MNAAGLVLGISTGVAPEVALVSDSHNIAFASDRGALESVATLLDQALVEAGATIGDLRMIGVCTGPGSFTGLRIGVSFARTLAQSLDLPIVGISSYDVVSFGKARFPLVSVARGKRDFYYARILIDSTSAPRFMRGARSDIEQVVAELASGGRAAEVVGPDFEELASGDAARAVARLAIEAGVRMRNSSWKDIAIDYGQPPNAVLNWERRSRTGRPP